MHDRNEIEHIITEMTRKNMFKDLAMMFITGHINYFDIFFCQYSAPKKFYDNVFEYIAMYIKKYIGAKKISELNRDIFSRISCGCFSTTKTFDYHVNKNYYSSKLIEATLDELTDRADFHNVNYIINTLASNELINVTIIVDILKRNELIAHHFVIEELINSEIISMKDIAELLLRKSKDVDFMDIKQLILTIFKNKRSLLSLAEEIMSHYDIIVSTDRYNRKTLEIKYTGESKFKEEIERIRGFISDIIWTDAEIEFYDWMLETRNEANANNDFRTLQVYKHYDNWFKSDIRQLNKTANYIYYGYEDTDSDLEVDKEFRFDMRWDFAIRRYWMNLSMMDGYDAFIKLFNINRFRLLNFEIDDLYRHKILTQIKMDSDMVSLAFSDDFYYFIKI